MNEYEQKKRLWIMEAHVTTNVHYLRAHPGTPKLCDAGVTCYERQAYRDIGEILAQGSGEVEDVIAWRVAELRVAGVDARPYLKKDGDSWCFAILMPDGDVVDGLPPVPHAAGTPSHASPRRRLGIIAAGGSSRRTGLGEYTSKAALCLLGKPLLCHQVDFLRRSGVDRVLVICRPEHARLLGSLLGLEDAQHVAFVVSPCASGWAGEVERAAPFIGADDEVVLVSCDNYHTGEAMRLGASDDALFTYTHWDRADRGPTDGPVLAREGPSTWRERPGRGFAGDLFTGYAVVRGGALGAALRSLAPSPRGEKEFTALLAALASRPRCRTEPYPGTYEDVADVLALAALDARLCYDAGGAPGVGAGVLLHRQDKRGCMQVLLTERGDGRGWVPPGGYVDGEEGYARAAVREVREETSIEVAEKDLRLLGVYPTLSKVGTPAASVIFSASWDGDVAGLHLCEKEVRACGWFSQAETRALLIPFNLRDAVEDHFAGRALDVRCGSC